MSEDPPKFDESWTQLRPEFPTIPTVTNRYNLTKLGCIGEVIKVFTNWLMSYRQWFAEAKDRVPLWMYAPTLGIYIDEGIPYVNTLVAEWLKDAGFWKRSIANEIIAMMIADSYPAYNPKKKLGGPPNKIVMANGVYDLKADTFSESFNPHELHITAIPVKYNPEATCPKIEEFLKQIVPNKQDRQALIEFAGYCLYRDYPIAVVIVLHGEGANGKTTFIRLLGEFLGPDNITAESPEDLETNRFSKAELRGKLANLCGDIPPKPLRYTGTIKTATGGDYMRAEKKNQDSFRFINHAKFLFSANQIPASKDKTYAFFRRMRIIDFPIIFGSDVAIPKDKLIADITTEEELSGFFNLVVRGFKEFMARGSLIGDSSVKEKQDKWIRFSEPDVWFGRFLEHSPGNLIPRPLIYTYYVNWCKWIGEKRIQSSDWFTRNINEAYDFTEPSDRWLPVYAKDEFGFIETDVDGNPVPEYEKDDSGDPMLIKTLKGEMKRKFTDRREQQPVWLDAKFNLELFQRDMDNYRLEQTKAKPVIVPDDFFITQEEREEESIE